LGGVSRAKLFFWALKNFSGEVWLSLQFVENCLCLTSYVCLTPPPRKIGTNAYDSVYKILASQRSVINTFEIQTRMAAK